MKKESVQFGEFSNDEWTTINGLQSFEVQYVLDRIKKEIDWTGYQLYVHGTILNDIDTHDIDMTIMGPVSPNRINSMLESIVRIGFEEKIYCDVKFSISDTLYDPTKDVPKTIRYACYAGMIKVDGRTYRYAEKVYGLYLAETKYPMTKTIDSGLEYHAPVQVI